MKICLHMNRHKKENETGHGTIFDSIPKTTVFLTDIAPIVALWDLRLWINNKMRSVWYDCKPEKFALGEIDHKESSYSGSLSFLKH